MFRTSNTCLWYIFNDVVVWPFGKVLFYNRGEILHFCMQNIVFQSIANQQQGSNTALNTVCPMDNEYASENRLKDTRPSVYSSFLIYSIGSFADIEILSSLIKDKMVSMLLIWLKMLRMKKHAICMSLIWSISSSISFGRSKVIEGTLLNSQQKITRLFWVQSQWPLQAMIKSESDWNKLKVSIFFLDSSNWNIDENHETMMTMRNESL